MPYEERICDRCFSDDVEDKEYFLWQCSSFNQQRNVFLHYITKECPSFSNLSCLNKFVWLMTTDDAKKYIEIKWLYFKNPSNCLLILNIYCYMKVLYNILFATCSVLHNNLCHYNQCKPVVFCVFALLGPVIGKSWIFNLGIYSGFLYYFFFYQKNIFYIFHYYS